MFEFDVRMFDLLGHNLSFPQELVTYYSRVPSAPRRVLRLTAD